MASPIQYTPQFIPTDLGLLERTLDKTQQRADSAYQGLLQADSQFANTFATNQDEAVKQEVLKDFRSRSADILKKYGNDFAKASKPLARTVMETGNNPFFQLAELKKRGIEQYNQLRVSYGSDAIEGRNPANIPIRDPNTGEYTSGESFSPEIYSSSTLDKSLHTTFSPRMHKLQETLMQNLGPQEVLTATTIKGITDKQVPALAEEMYNKLKQEAPLANDTQLRDKANSTALSYVQGEIKSFMADPSYRNRTGATKKIKPNYEFPEYNSLSYTDEPSIKNVEKTRALLYKAIDPKTNQFNPDLLKTDPNLAGQLVQPTLEMLGEVADALQYTGEDWIEMVKVFADLEGNDVKSKHNDFWKRVTKVGTGQTKVKQASSIYNLLNDKYSNLHTSIKNKPITYRGKEYSGEKGYIDLMLDLEEGNKVLQGTNLGIGHLLDNKDLYSMHRDHFDDKGKTDSYINMENPKERLSAAQIERRLGSTSTNITIDSRGNIMIQIPTEKGDKKENFIINPKALPIQTSEDAVDMNAILDIAKKYNLTDEEVADINNKVFTIGTETNTGREQFFRYKIDPLDKLYKTFEMFVPTELDEEGRIINGEWIPSTFTIAQGKLAKQVINSLKGTINE